MTLPTRILKIPQNLSLINAVAFCNHLHLFFPTERLILDCKVVQHIEPFTIAYVSSVLKKYTEDHPSIVVEFRNYGPSYAAHMGFYKAAGLNFGNDPGEARGSQNYIPLTIIKVGDIEREAAESYEHVGNIIEKESSRLAEMLIRDNDGELFDTLTYSLREIMRNVVEHSDSEVLEICAQYWPTKNKVEIAVLDSGSGVKKSLSNNPFLKIENDRDAIHLALMPAVSGKMFKGVKKRTNDAWQNSGFGLYMTNRIARNGGSFFLSSGSYGLLLSAQGKRDMNMIFNGTALRMVIDTTRTGNLSSSLARYRSEGYAIAKQYDKDSPIEPSLASTMLFRDFN